jgi:hypothetical protein
LPERPIALVGGPSAGKSLFLRQAIRRLREHLSAIPSSNVAIDAEQDARDLDRDFRMLDRGQVLAKTSGDVMQAVGLAVRLPRPHSLECLLYLYDAPGEHFASVRRFGGEQIIQYLGGIILLVDPFTLPPLADQGRKLADGIKPSETPVDNVVAVLIAGVNQIRGLQPTDPCKVPLAVVLTKADALPTEDYPFLANLCPGPDRPMDARLSDRCRETLVLLGAGNIVRSLEQKFASVRYFACTALGRVPDPVNTLPFHAAGVAEPFLWLLGLEPATPGQPRRE